MNYYVKQINSCESRILDKIDLLKRYGSDASKYEDELNQIIKGIDDTKVDYSTGSAQIARMQNETEYVAALSELKNLEEKIDSKQAYIKLHFRNSSLYREVIEDTDFDQSKLDLYVKEAISILDEFNDLNNNTLSESKALIKKIYSTVYEVIKLELIYNCESKLLNYITRNDIGIEYINDLVREDIETIKQNNSYDETIDKVINDISKDGLDYDYADAELLLLITLKTDKRILDRLDKKSDEFSKKIRTVQNSLDSFDSLSENAYDVSKNYERKSKKNRNKAIIGALLLALNILSLKVSSSIIKNRNTSVTYLTTREAYDTISDDVRTEEIYVKKGEKPYTVVKVYGEVDSNGNRKVTTYDMGDVELDNLDEYVDSADDSKRNHTYEIIDYRMSEQLSRNPYTTVERMTYGDKKAVFNEEKYDSEMKTTKSVLYSLIGLFGTTTLIELLLLIINDKKRKKYLTDSSDYEDAVSTNKDRIKKYKDLKNEILRMKQEQENGSLDLEEYKKMILK